MSEAVRHYIVLVEAVNRAATNEQWREADARRRGWVDGWAFGTGADMAARGCLLSEGDLHYLDQGMDRPMCGGVWLDWEVTGGG